MEQGSSDYFLNSRRGPSRWRGANPNVGVGGEGACRCRHCIGAVLSDAAESGDAVGRRLASAAADVAAAAAHIADALADDPALARVLPGLVADASLVLLLRLCSLYCYPS
mmetsp:Transcript_13926/g.30369  ORF Transcript_13926/g.30369 Transcript_13926/m.30369 type:complete len:110 (+) Transcript_13926:197-526(+)